MTNRYFIMPVRVKLGAEYMVKLFKVLLLIIVIFVGYRVSQELKDHPRLVEQITTASQDVKDEALKTIKKLQKQKEIAEEQPKEIKVDELGIPKMTDKAKMTLASEYHKKWRVYEDHYQNFTLLLPNNDGGYIAGKNRTIFGATTGKTTFNTLKQKLGTPLSQIQKGNIVYELSQDQEQLVYHIDGYFVTFFFDQHNHYKLRSVQYIKKNIEMQKKGYYGQASRELRAAYETLMVELINESRVEFGLKPLTYDKGLTGQARQHSQDMIDNHYFSHTGSDGSQPYTRMQAAGYKEQMYAENIAYGQYSSIYAHEGLMNSLGHRENILNPKLTHVGVGVAFDANNVPYYTINFYRPF